MTFIKNTTRGMIKSAALLGVTSLLAFGALTTPAHADWHGRGRPAPVRHWDHREVRGHRVFTGGYYAAPPVVYGNPYGYAPGYYEPPVVYDPQPGININLGIR